MHGDARCTADVLGLLDTDLDVLARDAGVIDPQVGVVASPDRDAWRREGQLLAVELEGGRGPSYLGVRGVPPAMLALETALLRTRKRPVVSSSLVSRVMLTGPVKT